MIDGNIVVLASSGFVSSIGASLLLGWLIKRNFDAVKDATDGIHTLVNSQMTNAKKSEYAAKKDAFDANTATLAMMIEVVALRKATGQEPTKEATLAIEVMRTKIADLEKVIAGLGAGLIDRMTAQNDFNDEQAAAAAR